MCCPVGTGAREDGKLNVSEGNAAFKTVLDLLKDLRSKTCRILSFIFGGHQASSAGCAHGVTRVSGTHSTEIWE